MEKLILRGVMWGADKIPDSVFEKIPGGYYKAKEEQYKREKAEEKAESRTQRHHRDNDDMPKRRSRRRYSEDDSDDRRHRAEEREDEYTSDGHGRRSDVQRHDGVGDSYDPINDRPRRRRSRADPDRGVDRSKRDTRNGEGSLNGGWSYHDGPVEPPPMSPLQAATGAAYGSPPPTQAVPNNMVAHVETASRSTSTLRGGMATGYVPYANIYGSPTQAQQYPPSDTGSVQPNHTNQVGPPVQPQQGYHQNPFAQEAPLGSQPGYVADPFYKARRYDDRHNERDQGTDGASTERGHSRSPPRRHRSRKEDYSPSRDSYSSRDTRRRARSERRHDDAPPSQARARERYVSRG
ncbi:hypothetical protein DOTSEDRAFT_68323 [Dothistroma septosporum NZE10]|uniref:Uncharacterized protein n=1 Tax=Dothistroma septosporum (strain NZE10 / CBS 128990) TaxID=675120 RepID=N1Q2P8_DOTSN|nr:hypothetical protein DOTSEDRAFT_68323 [Dothistroma septosporum NZE10]